MQCLTYCVILLACGCSLETGGGALVADGGMDASAGGDEGGAGEDDEPGDEAAPDGDGEPGDDGAPGDGDGGDDGTTDDGTPDGDDSDADGDASMDAGVPDGGDSSGDPDSGPPPSYTPAPGQVGAPCMNSRECDGFNATCVTERDGVTLPGGYCTHRCLGVCGANERCIQNFCVRTCEDDADCRAAEGYECRDEVCTVPGL